MIIQKDRSWAAQVLGSRGSMLSTVWPRIAATTGLATLLTVLHHQHTLFNASLTTVPFTLVGLALSIFLGFRNNTAYDRYWEGRKLWGQLVNTSRSACRQLLTLVAVPRPDDESGPLSQPHPVHRDTVYRLIAFAHALRLHLREQDAVHEVSGFLPAAEAAALSKEKNAPFAILQGLAQRIQEAARQGWIHPYHLPVLEGSLVSLTDILGACERIKNTPLPYSYTTLIHRIVAVYCFALPLGIVDTVGLVTPVVVLMVSYAFFGIDALGGEIENPFGTDANDLPLGALCRSIEINLRQRLGETDLPEPLAPQNGLLS